MGGGGGGGGHYPCYSSAIPVGGTAVVQMTCAVELSNSAVLTISILGNSADPIKLYLGLHCMRTYSFLSSKFKEFIWKYCTRHHLCYYMDLITIPDMVACEHHRCRPA